MLKKYTLAAVAAFLVGISTTSNVYCSNEHFILVNEYYDTQQGVYLYKLDKEIAHKKLIKSIASNEEKVNSCARTIFEFGTITDIMLATYNNALAFQHYFQMTDLYDGIIRNLLVEFLTSNIDVVLKSFGYDFTKNTALAKEIKKSIILHADDIVLRTLPISGCTPMSQLTDEEFASIFPEFIMVFRNNIQFFLQKETVYAKVLQRSDVPISSEVKRDEIRQSLSQREHFLIENVLFKELCEDITIAQRLEFNPFNVADTVGVLITKVVAVVTNFVNAIDGGCKFNCDTYLPKSRFYYKDIIADMQGKLNQLKIVVDEHEKKENSLKQKAKLLTSGLRISGRTLIEATEAKMELQSMSNISNLYDFIENLQCNINTLQNFQ